MIDPIPHYLNRAEGTEKIIDLIQLVIDEPNKPLKTTTFLVIEKKLAADDEDSVIR